MHRKIFDWISFFCLGVTVKGARHDESYSFRLKEDKGPIQSIKFNPSMSILAIKRASNFVEFINFAPVEKTALSPRPNPSASTTILKPDETEYTQLAKLKLGRLYDFNWISDTEILFVTDQTIEHYVVSRDKMILRLLKQHSVKNTLWQLFSREMKLLLISCGSPTGNSLIPFAFSKESQQNLIKYPKFDVDLPSIATLRSNSVTSTTSTASNQSTSRRSYELTEHDCLLTSIYGKSYLLIIRQVFRVPGQPSIEVVLYHIENDQKPAQKRHILRLNLAGKCALSVVDNFVLIHHQQSKSTFIYDIEEKSTAEHDGFQTIHQPILPALKIQPLTSNLQSLSPMTPNEIELYSTSWIVFLPNVIIDVKIGCIWFLSINLDYLLDSILDRVFLTEILLRRNSAQNTLSSLIRTLLTNIISPVEIDSKNIFDRNASSIVECWIEILQRIHRGYADSPSFNPMLTQFNVLSILKLFQTFGSMSNSSTFNRSFSIVSTDETINDKEHSKRMKFAVSIILEYIRSLDEFNVPVEVDIFKLLIDLLTQNNQFFQLQQFIQYKILTDSVELACKLLEISTKQQPTTQLALDMLKRLNSSSEEIIEILLENNFVLEALQFCHEHRTLNRELARKILTAAMKADELLSSTTSNQKIIFFTVYRFFEEFFQRTATIGALAQSPTQNEDDFRTFREHFNSYFQNGNSNLQQS